jgi:erythromycin esterase
MRLPHARIALLAAGSAALVAACGGGGTTSPAPVPARARPALPAVPPGWAAWVEAHQSRLRTTSATDANFDDLQFLKTAIGERRLVQIGESGHGVAEFDSVKVRLVRFLHEQMGFDVIAFESGLFECYRADERADTSSADLLMRSCIFPVWHADEAVPLFEYLRSTHGGSRPLTLIGMDTQFSTGTAGARPAELRALLSALDPALAEEAYALDTELVRLTRLDRDVARTQITPQVDAMTAGYGRIADFIEREQARLERAFPSRPRLPQVMGQSMHMAPFLVRSLAAGTAEGSPIRDEGMADNVTWLHEQLFPDRKMIVWAHNFHVQHDATELPGGAPTMGYYVSRRHRAALYTIGLFMYWGQAAWNDRTVYTLSEPVGGGLEALLGRTSSPASFVDLLGQPSSPGTAWMTSAIPSKSWGFYNETITPRRQYDGILFVDEVHPPHYR